MKVLEGKGIYENMIHENIYIGWCAYRIHGTAFYLTMLGVEHKAD